MDISGINSHMLQVQAQNRPSAADINWSSLEGDDRALMNAAKEFETYFIQQMFRAMRNTVDSQNSLFPRSQTEEIFQDMLDEQTSRAAVEGGRGIGLAQQIFNQMQSSRTSLQETLLQQEPQEEQYNGAYGQAFEE